MDICALRKWDFPKRWEFPKFPQDGKFPKLGKFPNLSNFPGIPVRKIPGREKFEAIWEGGNGNFPLNIPATRISKLNQVLQKATNQQSIVTPAQEQS